MPGLTSVPCWRGAAERWLPGAWGAGLWLCRGAQRCPAPQAPVDDSYWNLQAAFYRDVGAYRALLETPGCLRWDAAFHIFGGSRAPRGWGGGDTGSMGRGGLGGWKWWVLKGTGVLEALGT